MLTDHAPCNTISLPAPAAQPAVAVFRRSLNEASAFDGPSGVNASLRSADERRIVAIIIINRGAQRDPVEDGALATLVPSAAEVYAAIDSIPGCSALAARRAGPSCQNHGR